MAAVAVPLSLAERLAEAQTAAEGPAVRVGELETVLKDALDRQDYTTAQGVKNQLAEARTEHAVAAAAVTGLATALAEVERQKAEDGRVVAEQQQRDDARRRLATARRLEAEASSELGQAVEQMWAGIEAVRRTFDLGRSLESQVWQARNEQVQARVVLGELPAGSTAVKPNAMSALIEYHPGLQEILKCHR